MQNEKIIVLHELTLGNDTLAFSDYIATGIHTGRPDKLLGLY